MAQPATPPFSRPKAPGMARNARASIWMLLIAEFMLFFGLISSFFFLRNSLASWGPPTGREYELLLPLANSVLLFTSAATMHLSLLAIRNDQKRQFHVLLFTTALLGIGFIAGQVYELSGLGFSIQDGAYAGVFLLTIGTHAAHVAVGVLIFLVVAFQTALGVLNAQRHLSVELCALYWYFVVLIWVVIFAVLYFL